MALPLLTVVGSLMTGLGTVATTIVGYLSAKFTARIGFAIASVAAITALTAAMLLAINALLDQVSATLPGEVLAFTAAVMPTNLPLCVSVVFSAHVTKWVFLRNVDTVTQLSNG